MHLLIVVIEGRDVSDERGEQRRTGISGMSNGKPDHCLG